MTHGAEQALAEILSEGDPDTQYDFGDFAHLTTGQQYAHHLLVALRDRHYELVPTTSANTSASPMRRSD